MYLLGNYDNESFSHDAAIRYLEANRLDTYNNIADCMMYWSEANRHNIKFAFIYSQHLLETGNGASFWYNLHNNYAGLGVDGSKSFTPKEGYYYDVGKNQYFKGLHFDSKLKGIEAHFAHIDSYVFSEPRFNCNSIDSRYAVVRDIIKSKGLKYVDNFETLAPIYATDAGYYNKVMGIYHKILQFK